MKTPTVLQMEAVECGAAALVIVLGYFGRVVSLEQMRVECGVSRDGSKASNILRAARKFGLIANGYKKEPAELPALGFPLIVFWNFNHFLVVEGFGTNRVYLNDPACGRRVVSAEEFDQSFTGVVLTFQPGPHFEKGGERRSVYRSLRNRLPGTRLALAYVALAGIALALPDMVVPAFGKIFVDACLVGGNRGWIGPLLLIMTATALLRSVLTYLQQKYLLRLESKLAIGNASKFFWHVMRLPVEFFGQRYAGEIGSRVEINDTVASLISGELATNLIHLFTIGLYAALMFVYDPMLAVIAISIAALNLALLKFVSRRRADGSQKLLQERGKLQGVAMGGLQMIESLKSTGSESDFFRRWSGYEAKVLNAQQKLSVSSQSLAAVPPLLAALGTAAVLCLGGLRVMDGFLTLGMLVAFQGLLENFTQPVDNLTALGGKLQELQGDMRRLDDVLCHPLDMQLARSQEAATCGKLSGWLELCNISFGYSRLEAPLVRNFSLQLRPGARAALVGGSGSGKSTVAKLICGLYQPWEGEILLDGMERSRIARSVITASVAMVDQEIFLFEGTVRENLTLWDSTVPEDEIIQAARDACIHDDIMQWPGGYDHRVEEGGRNFSGGQRQRLEIARALIGNPSLLVLDEATSALDPMVEKAVEDNLKRRGCTCLIVAHRLSAIRDCEEIIVLDQGETVERGAHAELNEAAGHYARLIRAA